MIREALAYGPAKRDEQGGTALLGGLLTFFAFLVVPQIVLLGYFVRVLRGTARGDDRTPTFDGLIELFVDGVRAYVIWLGWTIIPLLVRFGLNGGHLEPGQATFWLLGWMLAPNVISVLERGAGATGLLDGFGFSEPYVDLLIVLYIIPAALANYADHGTIRAGFFDGGLRRFLEWAFDLVEAVLPRLTRLARRVLDRFIPESETEFGPVPTLTDTRYFRAWTVYFLLWMAGEVILRAFIYLPTPGGWLTVLNFVYLFGALIVFFHLRVSAWSVIGRTWPVVRPGGTERYDPADSENDATSDRQPSGVDTVERRDRMRRYGIELPPSKTVLAGGLLLTFGIVVLPGVFVAGYLIDVLRATFHREAIPTFTGGFGRIVDGLKAYAIWAGYLAVPTGLVFVAITSRSVAATTLVDLASFALIAGLGIPGGWPAVVLGLGLGAGGVLGILFVLVAMLPGALLPIPQLILAIPLWVALLTLVAGTYASTAALLVFARTESVRASFSPGRVGAVLRRRDYATHWTVAMIISVPAWLVLAAVTLIVVHPAFADIALVEPIAGLELLTFFSGPSSAAAISFWVALIGSGLGYFAMLVAATRVLGQVAPEQMDAPERAGPVSADGVPRRQSAGPSVGRADGEIETSPTDESASHD